MDEDFDKAWSTAVDDPISGVCLTRVFNKHEIGYIQGNWLHVRGMKIRYDLHRDYCKAFRAELFGKPWL